MTGPSAAKAGRHDLDRALDSASNLGLLSAGGPFEQYPGPVLVVARNGMVLSANTAGAPIAELCKRGMTAELRDAINSALSGKMAQINPFMLGAQGARGESDHAVDLVALPWAEGAAALLLGRDVSLERSLRGALIESRQRYKDLVEASSDFAWETDVEGRFTFVSPRGALGYPAATLVGQPAEDFLPDSESATTSPFVTKVPVDQVEIWFRDAAGMSACLSANAQPLSGQGGEWCGARGTCREITEERAHATELARGRHRERLLAYILRLVRDELEPRRMLAAAAEALLPAFSASGVAIYCGNDDGGFDAVAQAGAPPFEVLPASHGARIRAGEARLQQDDDSGRLLIGVTLYRDAANGALCLWRDVGEEPWDDDELALLDELAAQVGVANQQLQREAELQRLSATDPLTGLLNRRSFQDSLARECAQARRRGCQAALFFIDLDNFKLVNDRFGHAAGDKALLAVTQILRDQTRSGDLAARLGGDEFGLFFGQMTPDQANRKGEALLAAAASLADYSVGEDHPLGLSVGIAVLDPAAPEDPQSLIARADEAMYAVKHGGKGGLVLAPNSDGPGDS